MIVWPLGLEISAQQMADPNFNASVQHPAYRLNPPKVIIDEAHSNFHTAAGRYKPFADMLKSDGYEVVSGAEKFQKKNLRGANVLIISNAAAADASDDASESAFAEAECDVVRDWVRAGGSLLLIADHTPFGSAAQNLAKRFGVDMGKGFAFDLANSENFPSQLVFSQKNGLLGNHPLLKGRNASEQVNRVVAFTGQSLSLPKGAIALLKLSPTAYESPTRKDLQAALDAADQSKPRDEKSKDATTARPVGGRVQGLAMKFGKGRVVMLGEAAMFSAQVSRFKDGDKEQEFKMGMNVPGNDDRQFALNVMHWLSGLLK
jgi:hypothetical protein